VIPAETCVSLYSRLSTLKHRENVVHRDVPRGQLEHGECVSLRKHHNSNIAASE
jgi:hypothetical protein